MHDTSVETQGFSSAFTNSFAYGNGLLSQTRNSCPVSGLGGPLVEVVINSGVDGNSVVPQSTGSRSPSEPDLGIWVLLIHLEKLLQNSLGFRLLEALNTNSVSRVDEKSLPSSRRVDANDRMSIDDGLKLASHRIGVAVSRSIQALKTIEDFLESRRKLVIRSIARRPESVTANSGEMVKMKVSDSRGLRFVSQIGVPLLGGKGVFVVGDTTGGPEDFVCDD